MKNSQLLLMSLTLAATLALSQDAAESRAAPQWFLDEIATLTAGTGRWVADNADYRNEQEPFDAYVTEWRAAFGGTTMTGRLYGLQDGEPSVDFWEFRQYWHPARGEAVVEQFGWGGRVGIGTAWPEDGKMKSDQLFHAADGSSNRTGHISHFPDGDTHVTASFDIVDGEWQPRRSYTWLRDPES